MGKKGGSGKELQQARSLGLQGLSFKWWVVVT